MMSLKKHNPLPNPPKFIPLRAYLLLATLFHSLLLMAWAGILLISPMMFAGPKANKRAATFIFGTLIAYPIAVLVGIPGAWLATLSEHRRRDAVSLGLSALPLAFLGMAGTKSTRRGFL